MNIRPAIAIVAMSILAACSAPEAEDPPVPAEISPRDFVLLPCGPVQADRPCALIVAGGKRILFGAPAGVAATLSPEELRLLDSVVVFSMRAPDIEGLDEVRNESWRAGRDTPLLTIGPRGVSDLVEGLNKAFEQADALRIVEEGIPAGGYDAAILAGRNALHGQIVFDTGDVQVTAIAGGFRVVYDARAEVELRPCGSDREPPTASGDDRNRLTVGCEATGSGLSWPLQAAHFVVRHTPED